MEGGEIAYAEVEEWRVRTHIRNTIEFNKAREYVDNTDRLNFDDAAATPQGIDHVRGISASK
jgi:hypothetical protein